MTNTVPAYQCRPDGVYLWVTEADESPFEPGVFYPPGYATLVPPPDFGEGYQAELDFATQTWRLVAVVNVEGWEDDI